MEKRIGLTFALVCATLVGCGSKDSGSASSSSSSSPSSSSTSKTSGDSGRTAKPSGKSAPELKPAEDTKMGFKVSVPKDAEEKNDTPTFHTYNLGMPVDYDVAVQLMDDAEPGYTSVDDFADKQKKRIGADPISSKELAKDKYLVLFPRPSIHGKKVEADLWVVSGKKRFWVRCSAIEPNEQLATDMCTSFTPN